MNLQLEKAIVFFDLEATGLDVGVDKIVEIGLLKVLPNGEEQELVQRINPERNIPQRVIDVHGITNEDVKDMPTFKEFVPRLLEFIGNADLAGYNSDRFDIPLLVEEIFRAGFEIEMKNRRTIDVQNIFYKMEPRTLKAAYRFYCGQELVNAHSAIADIRATYEVLKGQLDRYEGVSHEDADGNVTTPVVNNMAALAEFSSFRKSADLAGQILYDGEGREVFNFGKYKGQSVEETFKREPQYYDWMMKSNFPEYTKKVITMIKLRSYNQGTFKIG